MCGPGSPAGLPGKERVKGVLAFTESALRSFHPLRWHIRLRLTFEMINFKLQFLVYSETIPLVLWCFAFFKEMNLYSLLETK